MKKLQKILEEVTEISQIPMILYDPDGNCTAFISIIQILLQLRLNH